MLKLIQLELQKNKLQGYILGAFITTFFLLAASIFLIIEEKIVDYNEVISIMNTLVSSTFIIFAALLLCKFIISEFKNNSISVLFMYPIQRKKLITAKLIIIVMFTFVFSLLSKVILVTGFYVYNDFYPIIQEKLTTQTVVESSLHSITGSLTTSMIGLIPLYIGMKKYSITATMVAALIMASVLNSQTGPSFTLSSIIFIPIIFSIVGFFIAYMSIRNIETKDIL